jgi:hypothetical protein
MPACWCGRDVKILNPPGADGAKCVGCGYWPRQCTCADPFEVAEEVEAVYAYA